jgi:hypothetical protein
MTAVSILISNALPVDRRWQTQPLDWRPTKDT